MAVHKQQIKKEKYSFVLNIVPNEPLRRYVCLSCGKVMRSEMDLKEHEVEHHKLFHATPKPTNPDEYQCDQCPFKN